MTNSEIRDARDNAYYSAMLSAWINTNMEKDRTLVMLSAGGAALLVTLLAAFPIRSDLQIALYLAGTIAYLAAIYCGVRVFELNATYIRTLKDRRAAEGEKIQTTLRRFDRGLFFCLAAGVALTVAVALFSAGPYREDCEMANDDTSAGERERIRRSLLGFEGMKPDVPTPSLGGLGDTAPKPPLAKPEPQTNQESGESNSGATETGEGK